MRGSIIVNYVDRLTRAHSTCCERTLTGWQDPLFLQIGKYPLRIMGYHEDLLHGLRRVGHEFKTRGRHVLEGEAVLSSAPLRLDAARIDLGDAGVLRNGF